MTVASTARFESSTPERVPQLLAEFLRSRANGRRQRVVLDGPSAAEPVALAESVTAVLRAGGTPATAIDAASFWRDASVRLEFGHTDVAAYAHDWLDSGALAREVLAPLGPNGNGRFLVALRDPSTNRSRREPYRHAAPEEIVIVAGELLLGAGLDFDTSVHLAVSSAARARRTRPEWAWTLPAHDEHDARVDPSGTADLVVRWNDPAHPAVRIGPSLR